MKKHTFRVLLCAICIFLVGFTFTGCDLEDMSFGGKSAYQIAVDNGFEGTQAEWLESLKGESGEYAGRGKSAYEIAVDNGFVGTEEEWLASLNTFEDVFKLNMNRCLTSVVSITARASSMSTTTSNGSGVIFEYKRSLGYAYVVTNFHVICDSTSHEVLPYINCYLYGREYAQSEFSLTTDVVGYSPANDIAVLKVYISSSLFDKSKVTVATLGTSSKIAVGQSVGAIGNAKGSGISLTRGVVSVDSEYTTFTRYDTGKNSVVRVLRYDAYIINGNSGGGLFNIDGELIGITNATSVSANFYYAIPVDLVYGIYQNIITNCTSTNKDASKLGLGVRVRIADSISILDEDTQTIYIKETVKVSYIENPQMLLKFNENDEIVSVTIQGETYEINRAYELSELMWRVNAGDNLKFKVKRGSNIIEVSVIAANLYNDVNGSHVDTNYDKVF